MWSLGYHKSSKVMRGVKKMRKWFRVWGFRSPQKKGDEMSEWREIAIEVTIQERRCNEWENEERV